MLAELRQHAMKPKIQYQIKILGSLSGEFVDWVVSTRGSSSICALRGHSVQ